MNLQSYGPNEEAIQKSIVPITETAKTKFFASGFICCLVIGAAALVVSCYIERQKHKLHEKRSGA